MALDPSVVETLSTVSTATLTTILLKKGLRNVWMRGTRPLRPGQARRVGRAFTLRFVPAREDLATPASWGAPISTRAAIEVHGRALLQTLGMRPPSQRTTAPVTYAARSLARKATRSAYSSGRP